MYQQLLNRIGVIVLLVLCLMMLAALVHGQERSMVVVSTNLGQGVGSVISDMGIVTKDGRRKAEVITALHVVSDDAQSITVLFVDGSESKATLLRTDEGNDLAWLSVECPDEIPILTVGAEPKPGQKLRLFGRDKRQADFNLPLISDGKLYGDCILKPGDSGGAVCNEDGCIVGVISGGWFWLDRKDENNNHMTWPLRAGLVR